MKKILLGFFSFLYLFVIWWWNPKYVELNHLMIIDKVNVKCVEDHYLVNLREVNPIRDENGIHYEYEKHSIEGYDFVSIREELEKQSKKKLYFQKAKITYQGCSNKQKNVDLLWR